MFFSNGLTGFFSSMFQTHPPLITRIKKIDARFDGNYPQVDANFVEYAEDEQAMMGFSAGAAPVDAYAAPSSYAIEENEFIQRVGAPQDEHLDYARGLLAELPQEVIEAVHNPSGARALVYCLLLDSTSDVRDKQLAHIADTAEPGVREAVGKLSGVVSNVAKQARLPLIDISLTALRNLSVHQYSTFRKNVGFLIQADLKVSLFEYVLSHIIRHGLDPHYYGYEKPRVRYRRVSVIIPQISELLATLASFGAADKDQAREAYQRGLGKLGLKKQAELPGGEISIERLDSVLHELAVASSGVKETIIRACIECVGADGKVTVEEAELLRAISDALECPVPPFLPTDV